MNKNRENFIKYSNDLYFHHLLVENEKIRTLICQELVSDRKIISIKLKKAIEEYIKYYNEKRINVKRKGLSPLAYRQQSLS
ncbi:IS3 family transposase [Faecalibacillus intestinalis]